MVACTDLIFRTLYPWRYEVLPGNQPGLTRNGQRNADQYCQAVTHLTAEFDQLHKPNASLHTKTSQFISREN